jgi:hypothetical protein
MEGAALTFPAGRARVKGASFRSGIAPQYLVLQVFPLAYYRGVSPSVKFGDVVTEILLTGIT